MFISSRFFYFVSFSFLCFDSDKKASSNCESPSSILYLLLCLSDCKTHLPSNFLSTIHPAFHAFPIFEAKILKNSRSRLKSKV